MFFVHKKKFNCITVNFDRTQQGIYIVTKFQYENLLKSLTFKTAEASTTEEGINEIKKNLFRISKVHIFMDRP